MSVTEILKAVGEFQSGATVKNVYGEPVTHGDRTVIPVARVAYGFGGGGGSRDSERTPEGRGGGGGGGGRMTAAPAGVVEITPAGTRFISFTDWTKLAAVAAVSLAIGLAIGKRNGK
jgi:uncharacterized spore protein YtfJ